MFSYCGRLVCRAAKSLLASLGKYDNWYLFIVLKYGVQRNEPLLPTSLRLSAPGSKTSIIMKMGRVLGLQSNRCLVFPRRMRACIWGIHFFQIHFIFERPKRRAWPSHILHTEGQCQSASLPNMAAVGYIYWHTCTYGMAITAQSRVQPGAAPSPLWLLADVARCAVVRGNMKRWRLVVASLGPASEQIISFQLQFIPQSFDHREDLFHFPTELQNTIKSDSRCFLFRPLVYIYSIFCVPG